MMVESIASMMLLAVLSVNGQIWMYPVNRSTAKIAFLLPFWVVGMLGIRSIAQVTLGA